jgi:hypothetical protein
MKKIIRSAPGVALAVMLASCGGGSGSTIPAATATAVFRDSPVAGLYYENSNRSGYTDSQGRFAYVPGEPLTFWIGDLQLGTFTPTQDAATLSPGSLVPAGTTDRALIVSNIARLLQTADDDGNPANGITISTALDTAAMNWPVLNLDSNLDVDSAAATVLASIRSITTAAPSAYVSAAAAVNHLAASMDCAYTGAYVATFSPGTSTQSRVGLVLDGSGSVSALQYFTTGATAYAFHSPTTFDYSVLPADDSLTTTVQADASANAWLRYNFRLGESDHVWVNTTQTGATAFTGSDLAFARLAGKPDAGLRFEGIVRLSDGNDYLFVLEVPVAGTTVSGSLMDLHSGVSVALTGSVSGSTLAATASFSDRSIGISGSYSGTPPLWTATFTETANNVPVTQAVSTTGCALN